MKTSPLPFFFLFLFLAAAPGITRADTGSTSAPVASDSTTSGTSADQKALHREQMKEAFAQLDLTDAQKAQIKQIRQTVTDRQERREQIKNVLTPDQQAKLQQLREQYKDQAAPATNTP